MSAELNQKREWIVDQLRRQPRREPRRKSNIHPLEALLLVCFLEGGAADVALVIHLANLLTVPNRRDISDFCFRPDVPMMTVDYHVDVLLDKIERYYDQRRIDDDKGSSEEDEERIPDEQHQSNLDMFTDVALVEWTATQVAIGELDVLPKDVDGSTEFRVWFDHPLVDTWEPVIISPEKFNEVILPAIIQRKWASYFPKLKVASPVSTADAKAVSSL